MVVQLHFINHGAPQTSWILISYWIDKYITRTVQLSRQPFRT